jgi:hypothetical protein
VKAECALQFWYGLNCERPGEPYCWDVRPDCQGAAGCWIKHDDVIINVKKPEPMLSHDLVDKFFGGRESPNARIGNVPRVDGENEWTAAALVGMLRDEGLQL